MHFIGTIREAQSALAGIRAGEAIIFGNAAAAMGLDGIVEDLQRHTRGLHLTHGDFRCG